ncbi:hypothetical protein ACFWUP_29315 [Nocardia sp. NPDC058658]|uniref:hypothetical protein n=1 Tax=Nocardia sp. NPDC058658 TaxID=3346580 RepID=UPI0036681DB8
MIIWTRWGILFFLLIPVVILPALAVEESLMGGPARGAGAALLFGLNALIVTVVWALLWYLIDGLDKPRRLEVVGVDGTTMVEVTHPETGEPIEYAPTSSLFFVPIKYLPMVSGTVAFIALVAGATLTVAT